MVRTCPGLGLLCIPGGSEWLWIKWNLPDPPSMNAAGNVKVGFNWYPSHTTLVIPCDHFVTTNKGAVIKWLLRGYWPVTNRWETILVTNEVADAAAKSSLQPKWFPGSRWPALVANHWQFVDHCFSPVILLLWSKGGHWYLFNRKVVTKWSQAGISHMGSVTCIFLWLEGAEVWLATSIIALRIFSTSHCFDANCCSETDHWHWLFGHNLSLRNLPVVGCWSFISW